MAAFQARRDHASFEALYAAAAPGLLAWIERLHLQRRHPGDPRETLQDTFVNIHRYVGTFRASAPGGFRSWARTIAVNALRRTRRPRAGRAILQTDLGESTPEPADVRLEPSAAAALGEDALALRSGLTLLMLHYARCFDQLSSRDRAALRMVEVEGRSYAEVGEVLGTERSNTKMVVFRARRRLQALAAACLEPGEEPGKGHREGHGEASVEPPRRSRLRRIA